MPHEEVASFHPGLSIEQSSLSLARLLQVSNGLSSLLIERHDPLLFGFACRYAKSWGPIRVAIQAIDAKALNFLSSGSAPACNEQRCPLIWAVECANRWHELSEFLLGNVAWDGFGQFRQIPMQKRWTIGNILPFPTDGIRETD